MYYNDNWGNGACAPAGGNAAAYLTRVENALGQATTAIYNSCTGTMATITDPNSQATLYAWDWMGRITNVYYPDGGQTNYLYPNTTTVERQQKMTSAWWLTNYRYFDGLGRAKQTRLVDGEGDVFVDTTYDPEGRVSSVSNPYRTTSDPTYGTTHYDYDPLNRITATTTYPDADVVQSSYSGACTTVTDQTLRQRKSCADSLGRLTSVLEPDPNNTLTWETDYQYNALDNLTRADQKGGSTDSGQWRTRTFAYDSLSRLTSANNPESGTINYAYDADGNVTQKTDARGVTTTLTYDPLHRLTQKVFSDGSRTLTYFYDDPRNENPIGRLTAMSDNVAVAASFSYDAVGRQTHQSYCLPSDCSWSLSAHAGYDFAGNLIWLIYPSGRKIKNLYTTAGRLKSVTFDSFNGQPISNYNYWTADPDLSNPWGASTYWPTGALHVARLGNGVFVGGEYNTRLQQSRWFAYSSGAMVADRGIGYHENGHNNGNVRSVSDNLNSANNQSYGYDQLNRISSASSSAWSQTFTIDPWGNLKQFGTWNFVQNYDANNRLSGYAYDGSGNLFSDTFHNYSYDAESRIKQVDGGASATYTYGADGQRVRKDTPVDWTEYVSFGGNIIAEKNSNGSWTDYIFANGNRVARVDVGSAIVRFTNDSCSGCGGTPVGGGDRNLFVNSITIGSSTIYPNDPSVSYTAAPCNSTQGNLGVILCNGDMIASTDAEGQSITVNAYGSPDYNVYPHMQVWVNGMLLGEWDVTGTAQNYIARNLIDVRFTNDSCSGCGGNPVGGGDRNLAINSVTVGSTTIPPNDPSVWYNSPPCNGYSGWAGVLACNGDLMASTAASGQTVTVNAYGWPDYDVYPHIELWLNGMMIGQWDVTGSAQSYTATIANRGVHYYHADHLGTARLETDSTGAVVSNCTYAPFGQELGCSPADQTNHYKFTGKERDSESGLDYFGLRYMGSSLGRFMSPDPGQASGFDHMDDPQSWNGYAYARNNPLIYTDPDGLNYTACDTNGKNCADLTDKQFQQYLKENPNVSVSASGQLSINVDGSSQKLGSATYYNEKDIQAAQMLVQTGATLSDPRTIAGFYGASAILGVSLYAAGAFEGGLTTLELGAEAGGQVTPTAGQAAQISRQLAQQGRKSLEKSLRTLERRLAEHEAKLGQIREAGGHASSVEREISNFKGLIQAIKTALGK